MRGGPRQISAAGKSSAEAAVVELGGQGRAWGGNDRRSRQCEVLCAKWRVWGERRCCVGKALRVRREGGSLERRDRRVIDPYREIMRVAEVSIKGVLRLPPWKSGF